MESLSTQAKQSSQEKSRNKFLSVGTCSRAQVVLRLAPHVFLVIIKLLDFVGYSFKTLIFATSYFKVFRSDTFVFKLF